VYVTKTANSAFTDPKSSVMNLTSDLLVEWSTQISLLQEWMKLFMLVNNSSKDGPTLAAHLEAKELFAISGLRLIELLEKEDVNHPIPSSSLSIPLPKTTCRKG
jgi:hypothetical protein